MNLDKILECQEVDFEIKKLEKSLETNESSKAMKKFQDLAKQAQQMSKDLEIEAENAVTEYKKIQKNYNESVASLQRLEATQNKELTDDQYNDIIKQANNISNYLSTLEKFILQLADKVNKIVAEYENAKSKYRFAKINYTKNKEIIEKLTQELAPQIKALEEKRANIEKEVDPILLKKYNSKKQDNIFPVFVQLRDNMCGGCMMELPSAQIDKLKKDGFLECENERCHKIIYIKQ